MVLIPWISQAAQATLLKIRGHRIYSSERTELVQWVVLDAEFYIFSISTLSVIFPLSIRYSLSFLRNQPSQQETYYR